MPVDTPLLDNLAAIARATNDRLYDERPELVARYGPRGRARCEEDTRLTVQHLADSVWAEEPGLFEDYVAWCVSMLAAYGVERADSVRSFELLAEVLPSLVPAETADAARAHIDGALFALPELPPTPLCEPGIAIASGTLARKVLDALLAGDRSHAEQLVIDEFLARRSLQEIYVYVIAPVQREVGRLWQTRRVTIAREHMCTSAIQAIMGRLSLDVLFRDRPRLGPVLIAAAVQGERHELGIRTVADLFDSEGWRVTYCGADTPTFALAEEVRRLKPRVVALSATISTSLRKLKDAITTVREAAAPAPVRVIVGGRAFARAESLCRKVGADVCAKDAGEALREARAFAG